MRASNFQPIIVRGQRSTKRSYGQHARAARRIWLLAIEVIRRVSISVLLGVTSRGGRFRGGTTSPWRAFSAVSDGVLSTWLATAWSPSRGLDVRHVQKNLTTRKKTTKRIHKIHKKKSALRTTDNEHRCTIISCIQTTRTHGLSHQINVKG